MVHSATQKSLVRMLRRPFTSGEVPLVWSLALGHLAVEITTDDLTCGQPDPMLLITKLPTSHRGFNFLGVLIPLTFMLGS